MIGDGADYNCGKEHNDFDVSLCSNVHDKYIHNDHYCHPIYNVWYFVYQSQYNVDQESQFF